jgi:predicted small secreted protein
MGAMARSSVRLHRVVAVLAAVMLTCLVLAGCNRVLGPREWTMQAARTDGTSYSIRVRDTSGRIDNVEIDPTEPVPALDSPENPPGEPNLVLVPWTGGECDTQTDILIEGGGPGLVITVATSSTATACNDVGVPHMLRIRGSGPLPADSVQVSQGT